MLIRGSVHKFKHRPARKKTPFMGVFSCYNLFMNPELNSQDVEVEQKPSALNSVTPLSKYLAMILFIIMPFIGGWIGYTYTPVKIVEVEILVLEKSLIREEGNQIDLNSTTATTLSGEELFQVWGQYQKSGTIIIGGDSAATIENDFPSSNEIIYQTKDKQKTFFTVDDSRYYYSNCQPLFYLDLSGQRYHNFPLDYCPSNGVGTGVKNAKDALPVVLQYGKKEEDLYGLNLETEREVLVFSTSRLTANESLIAFCAEGNYVFQEFPDMEVIDGKLRIGVYEKDTTRSCVSEKEYKKLRDVIISL